MCNHTVINELLIQYNSLRSVRTQRTVSDTVSNSFRTVRKLQPAKPKLYYGPSIKYVTLQGGRGSGKVWQFVTGEGGVKIMWRHTFSFFPIPNLMFYIWYFIIHSTNWSCKYHLQSCKKVNLYCSVTALLHVGTWIKDIGSKGVILLSLHFFLIFSWTWKNIYEKIGYPRGFNLRCLDGWTLGIDPIVSNLQTLSLSYKGATWFETRSTLHKKLKKYKTPYPRFNRFCYKTVLQISHNHASVIFT